MPPKLSITASAIQPSATLSLNAKAQEMIDQGIDVVKLTCGEPDFDIPDHMKTAMKQAIDDGFTNYTATPGITKLRKAACAQREREFGIKYQPNEVIFSNGGKQVLDQCFAALLNEGDEVIVPSPYWVSYDTMVTKHGGSPVFIATNNNGFRVTAEMIEAAITDKTTIIALNSPSNPTGAVINQGELEKIAELAKKHDLWVISDEVYKYFLYGDQKMTSIANLPEMKERTIVIDSVSKAYAGTGVRLGWGFGPSKVIKVMGKLQAHATSNPNSISQMGGLALFNHPEDTETFVKQMMEAFIERREYIISALNAIEGINIEHDPEGAFYVFPNIAGCYNGKIKNSAEFAEFLLVEHHVAIVPGSAFGEAGEDYIRISYAASMEELKKAVEGIRNAVHELKGLKAA